jgi:hypothetical protein
MDDCVSNASMTTLPGPTSDDVVVDPLVALLNTWTGQLTKYDLAEDPLCLHSSAIQLCIEELRQALRARGILPVPVKHDGREWKHTAWNILMESKDGKDFQCPDHGTFCSDMARMVIDRLATTIPCQHHKVEETR